MATFLFMLTPETEQVLVERVTQGLDDQFSEHEFIASGADIPEFENTILAVHGTTGSGEVPGILRCPTKRKFNA